MAPGLPKPSKATPSISSRAWEALTPPLSQWILEYVSSMGFERMTPVQASTISLFNTTKDVLVEAVTGSGKTLAYLIPILERLLRLEEPIKRHHVGGIILAPTRELAIQIHGVLRTLLAFHEPSAAAMSLRDEGSSSTEAENTIPPSSSSNLKVIPQLLVGGDTSPAQDLRHFLNLSPNLLVATPGRLVELLSSSRVHCPQSSFEMLVLDEGDRLLDLGFKDDLQKILGRLPKQRRTGLFSASMNDAVNEIVRVGLRNPVKITVKVKGEHGREDKRTPSSLQMKYLVTPASHKFPAISKILSTLNPFPNKSIIFFSTCAAVDYFQHVLPSILPSRFKLVPLHGKHPPKVRLKNFAAFADANTPSILLTTDVAARGLDLEVDVVLQEPPSDPKVFLHRSGRTARAGKRGLSIVFLQPGREEDYLPFLEVRRTPVTPLTLPNVKVSSEEAQAATEAIRKMVLADKAIHEKGQKALVSCVKAYTKHQAKSVFRIEDVDWEDLGKAFGLLKLPKMPELKKFDGDRSLGVNLDWSEYAFKDKKREEMRKQALVNKKEAPLSTDASIHPQKKELKRAWSNKLDQRDEREARRTKKRTKQEWEKWEHMTLAEREKQLELERMIEEVKAKKLEEERYGEFEGFDD